MKMDNTAGGEENPGPAKAIWPGLGRFWHDHLEEFTVHYAADFIKGLELYGGLAIFQWINRVMAATGMKPEYLDQFERLHFFSTFAIYTWLAIMFLWRLVFSPGRQVAADSGRARRK